MKTRKRLVLACRGEVDGFIGRAPVPYVGAPKPDRLLIDSGRSVRSRSFWGGRRRRGGLERGNGLLKKIQLVHSVGRRQGSKNFYKKLVNKPRGDRFALKA